MYHKSTWIALGIGTIALAALLASGIFTPPPTSAMAIAAEDTSSSMPRTITVIGQGAVSSSPDIATASVGVMVTSPDIKEATSEASNKMEAVMEALKEQGIADKDIRTTSYSINYERRSSFDLQVARPSTTTAGEEEIEGMYHVSNMVTVKIRDLEKVGQVIDAVVNAGANSIWGINFGIDDTTALESEARSKAVDNARARAEELAGLAGVELGKVVSVSEIITGSPYPTASLVRAEMALGGGAGPISPGELEMSAQIQVTFEIE